MRWILFIELRAKPSTNAQRSGTLYFARLAAQCAASSASVIDRAGHELDRGHDAFAEPLVGDPEHRARRDAVELLDHPFDLGGVHVRTTAQDHEALAVADVEDAVVVDEAEVTGVQQTAAQRLGARVRLLPVAEHRVVHAGPRPVGVGRDAHFVVDDPHVEVRERSAARRRRCAHRTASMVTIVGASLSP